MKIITDGIFYATKKYLKISKNMDIDNLQLAEVDIYRTITNEKNLPILLEKLKYRKSIKVAYWGLTGNKKQAHKFIFNADKALQVVINMYQEDSKQPFTIVEVK